MIAILLILAFLWDQIIGDPHKLPHPVRWIGRFISICDCTLNQNHYSALQRRLGGIITVALVLSCACGFVLAVLKLGDLIHPNIYIIIWIISVGIALSGKSLYDAGQEIFDLLETNQIEQARYKLSWIVGRDTHHLNPSEIRRATIETISENYTDGFLSPLLYAALGGPLFVWCIKAISTMDSMIAYKNEKYLEFGWAAAKLDDLVHFLPARIAGAVVIPLAALLCKLNYQASFRTMKQDRLKHPSPNSAHSESAFAGALDLTLGGISTYTGIKSYKPLLGTGRIQIQQCDLAKCLKLYRVSSYIGLLYCIPISFLVYFIFK